MSITTKVVLGIVAVSALAFVLCWGGAVYLVSRLDGTGGLPAQAGVHAPDMEQYSSEDGVQFMYPATYQLSSRTEGNAERKWDVLVLLPRGYEAAQYTEGPPAISLSVFPNTEGLSLLSWVQGDAHSNFKLLQDPGGMGSTTVGNEPALVYTHTGLYETDTVVVAHKGKIFMFEAGWMSAGDPIREDFQNLVSTVQFTQ